MPPALQPRDTRDVCDAVAAAAAAGETLEITGGGSKSGIGFPGRGGKQLSMTNFSRVIDYDPAELVLTVEPGVWLSELEGLLAQNGQMLAFDPWDFSETVGGASERSTIGGVVGAGLAGSRRISSGGVRDHILGFAGVNGRGEAFKAGGKVVKNVTGYDLPKLMAGSWGQLCVFTELTLKVLPRPRETLTLTVSGIEPRDAVRAMSAAMGSPADVAAAAYAMLDGKAVVAIRIEGFGPSVDARSIMLEQLLNPLGRTQAMEGADKFWRSARNATALDRGAGALLWRISVPPAQGAAVLDGVQRLGGAALLDWAGGLCWARTGASATADVRRLAETAGGHAMLADAPADVRKAMPALHPEAPGVAALSRRVRASFDPSSVFDPKRFEAGA